MYKSIHDTQKVDSLFGLDECLSYSVRAAEALAGSSLVCNRIRRIRMRNAVAHAMGCCIISYYAI